MRVTQMVLLLSHHPDLVMAASCGPTILFLEERKLGGPDKPGHDGDGYEKQCAATWAVRTRRAVTPRL
jgi:hypothetical protein